MNDQQAEAAPVRVTVRVSYLSGPVDREVFTNVFDSHFTDGFLTITALGARPMMAMSYMVGNPIPRRESATEFTRQNIKQVEIAHL
jgi:hypothetical protein